MALYSHLLIIIFYLSKLSVLAQQENQFIYNGFHGVDLHLDGMAEIHSNGLLQLTNSSNQRTGHAFYRFPMKFYNSSPGLGSSLSFSTTFVFAIFPQLPSIGGHGIVFTISPSMDFTGAVPSQYMGLFNTANNGLPSNHIFAIELDTILSPDMDDINDNHVGIDVNGLKSNASIPAAYFSDKKRKNVSLKLISGKPTQVWIDYDEVKKQVSVTLAPFKRPKPSRPLLLTSIDLSLILLDSMYVGFSSATGAVTSDHYILGWSFNKTGQAQGLQLSKLPSLPQQIASRKKRSLKITISAVAAVVFLTMMSIAAYMRRKKKFEELREDWEIEYGPQRFLYKNLYKATKGFKSKELLGTGGFGEVFRGILPSSNKQVAVKRVWHDSKHGMKEFVAEIASMGKLRHRNLVQLLGYCRRKGELLLVYEYMPNGSLDKFLFSNETPNLNWRQRYRILRGVASSLLYLHEEWEQIVLHRDVKASNVLLDGDLNGRLGDFGLARLYDHGSLPQTTHVVGTVGYLAPELTRTGKATTSTDVFSFGAFLLEVACGRKPIEIRESAEAIILVEWVFESWKRGSILDVVDPRLEGDYVVEEIELVLKLGLLCSQQMPMARPSMRQVMQYLDGNAVLPEIPPEGAAVGILGTGNQGMDDLLMSSPSSLEMASANSLCSNDSVLNKGR